MPERKKLSKLEKIAILLLTLGEDLTAEVFKRLPPNIVKKIATHMAELKNIPASEVEEVAEEFLKFAENQKFIVKGGEDIAKNILLKALGDKAKEIAPDLVVKEKIDPFRALQKVHPRFIADMLKNEHPQVIAFILAKLGPEKSSQILPYLSDNIRYDVVRRMVRLENVSHVAMQEIEESLRRQLSQVEMNEQEVLGGVKVVADLLNLTNREVTEEILSKIEQENPDLAEEIRDKMFVFEDIVMLDDRSVQTLLREVSNDILLLALKTASEEIKEKFFKNMSSRAAEMLKEDLETMGPVKVSEVENAQKEIVKIVRKLIQEGKITLGRGEEMV